MNNIESHYNDCRFTDIRIYIFGVLSFVLLFFSVVSGAESEDKKTIMELRQQLSHLTQRTEKLERQQVEKQLVLNQAPIASHSFNVSGRIRMETIANWPSVGGNGGSNSGDYFFLPVYIPTNDSGERGQLSLSARNSRLRFTTKKMAGTKAAITNVEVDFWGSAGNERITNSHNPRLRHAYANVAGLTFGQTNTNFMHSDTWPISISNPVGVVIVRQPLVAYSTQNGTNNFAVSLEQPESTLLDDSGTRVTPDDDRFPDMTLRWISKQPWGKFFISGLLREIRADGFVSGVKDEALGGALHISGRLNLLHKDNLRLGVAYGNAFGRYTGYNLMMDGSINKQGKISLHPTTSAYASYQHWWNERWKSVVAVGFLHTKNDRSIVPLTVPEWAASYHANIGVSLWKNVFVGVEYSHAKKVLENKQVGKLGRVLLVSNYNF